MFYKLVFYSLWTVRYAWSILILLLVSFFSSNTYIARYARICRTEIYCAIGPKTRLKLIYRTFLVIIETSRTSIPACLYPLETGREGKVNSIPLCIKIEKAEPLA